MPPREVAPLFKLRADANAARGHIAAAYQDLGTLRPQVSLSEMSHNEGSDHATATLFSRWDVSTSATDWTYETQVDMTLVDDDRSLRPINRGVRAKARRRVPGR